MEAAGWPALGLWLAVLGSGVYHGISPGMGWPLAVSAGLMGRGRRDLLRALPPLAAGHVAATLAILLPFALLVSLAEWQREVRIGASAFVVAFGAYRLVDRRHPRALARIRPTQLALWSFAIALAHGAGLMLLPVALGICSAGAMGAGEGAAATLMARNAATALAVALVHAAAMVAAGGAVALAVHGWLGLRFVARSWFDLDRAWAVSLILVGGVGLIAA